MTQIVYIGPFIHGLIRKNQVFAFYPKDTIAAAEKIHPIAKQLFVSMDDLPNAKRDLKTKGTLINTAYDILCKSLTRKEQ